MAMISTAESSQNVSFHNIRIVRNQYRKVPFFSSRFSPACFFELHGRHRRRRFRASELSVSLIYKKTRSYIDMKKKRIKKTKRILNLKLLASLNVLGHADFPIVMNLRNHNFVRIAGKEKLKTVSACREEFVVNALLRETRTKVSFVQAINLCMF